MDNIKEPCVIDLECREPKSEAVLSGAETTKPLTVFHSLSPKVIDSFRANLYSFGVGAVIVIMGFVIFQTVGR